MGSGFHVILCVYLLKIMVLWVILVIVSFLIKEPAKTSNIHLVLFQSSNSPLLDKSQTQLWTESPGGHKQNEQDYSL